MPDIKNLQVEPLSIKARYWWFFVYPDSAPDNWVDMLQMTGLPFAVSPLHDKDVNPTGETKKAHYHVIVCFNGPTTYNNVKKNITDVLHQPHPQYLMSVKGAYRYLCHQDNPEKYQYNTDDIKTYGGFNLEDYATMSLTEEDRLYDAIEEIIFKEQIYEYYVLNLYLRKNGLFELRSFLRRHTYHFQELLRSLRNAGAFAKDELIESDPETGECKK